MSDDNKCPKCGLDAEITSGGLYCGWCRYPPVSVVQKGQPSSYQTAYPTEPTNADLAAMLTEIRDQLAAQSEYQREIARITNLIRPSVEIKGNKETWLAEPNDEPDLRKTIYKALETLDDTMQALHLLYYHMLPPRRELTPDEIKLINKPKGCDQ